MVVKGNNIFLPQKGYQTKPNGKLVLHWSKNSSQALPTPAGSHVTYCMPYTVLHLDEHSMSLDLNHMAQHSPRHLCTILGTVPTQIKTALRFSMPVKFGEERFHTSTCHWSVSDTHIITTNFSTICRRIGCCCHGRRPCRSRRLSRPPKKVSPWSNWMVLDFILLMSSQRHSSIGT